MIDVTTLDGVIEIDADPYDVSEERAQLIVKKNNIVFAKFRR